MHKGDISNEVVPRLVLVFEGLVGVLPDAKARAKYDKYLKRGKFKEAADLFVIQEQIAKHIWHIYWTKHYNMDVVTYTHPGIADALNARLNEENFPIGRVYYSTPSRLARDLSYRPDIAMVYDADPARVFTYGSKGTIIELSHPRFL